MDGQQAVSNFTGLGAPCPSSPKESHDLSKLTPGERLWLWRLSERTKARSRRGVSVNSVRMDVCAAPRNQLEAAVQLGLDSSVYWAAEKDLSNPGVTLGALSKVVEPPYTLVSALKVARRRSRLSVGVVAVGSGVGSKPTFYKLEAAGDMRVVEFWRSQGFKFPRELLSDL
jgi:hypothetical protein